jgi:hypothetical protein
MKTMSALIFVVLSITARSFYKTFVNDLSNPEPLTIVDHKFN